MTRLYAYAIAAALLISLGAIPAWIWQGHTYSARIGRIEADHAKAYAQSQAEARAEEVRRQAAIEGVRQDAQERIAQLEADISDAGATADSLREELARRTRRAAPDSGAADGGAAAFATLVLYSELLDRADRRAQELAEEADRRRVAGLMCEKSYDALNGI